ncbi:MAG: hypothetical protein ACI8WB_002685 [Phenylobacterium sp.]|jgi:hypothetical protein
MKLGNVATGEHFYNRTADLNDIWQVLADNHLILSGPRRLGKTSILYKLIEQADKHGYQAQIVDVQGIDSAQGFINSLKKQYASLKANKASLIDKFNPFKSIKAFGVAIEVKDSQQPSWQEEGDYVFNQLAADKLLILVDEFSIFLETLLQRNYDEAVDFLAWLRRWRIAQNLQCKFIFTGSIGLQALLEKHGLVAEMNDCFDYILGPFKTKHAVAMLQQFATQNSYLLDDNNAKMLCDKIGWLSPFFINLLLNESINAARDRLEETVEPLASEIIGQDIEDGYERLLVSRSRFSHWESRLKKQLPATELSFCMTILTDISKSDDGLSLSQLSSRLQKKQVDVEVREQLIQKLRLKLTDEGYLSSPDEQGKIHFLSFLLKDYWKRNHG